jgi:Rrf2 family protein
MYVTHTATYIVVIKEMFMSASTKLSNSVKALCFLAYSSPEPCNSTLISKQTGINASKLRKLFSALAKENILTTIQGPFGGFLLARDPSDIRLQEIYCALEHKKAFHLDVNKDLEPKMKESGLINLFFTNLFSEIQVEIEDKMKLVTLADIIHHTK